MLVLLLLLRYLARVLHGGLKLLLLLLLLILLLKAVELVVLEQDALLDHRLVRLREEVVLLNIVIVVGLLVGPVDFGHVALQVGRLEDSSPFLLL